MCLLQTKREDDWLTEKIKTLVVVVISLFLFILGVAGLILPVIPGLVLIALSLFLLSTRIPSVKRHLEKLEKRFPQLREKIRKWRNTFSIFY